MASEADKNLSQEAQREINDITAKAQSGAISWADANKQANAVREREGADYTVSAKGTTTYNDGSTISNYGSGSKASGGKAAQATKKNSTSTSVYGSVTTPTTTQAQGGGTYASAMPNATRNTALKDSYSYANGYTTFYDERGYPIKTVKGVTDYTPHQDYYVQNGTYNGGHLWTDEELLTPEQLAEIQGYRDQMKAGLITAEEANRRANQVRSGSGYIIDQNGNVTNLLNLNRVNDDRARLGLPTNPESMNQAYARYLMGTDTSPMAYAEGKVMTFDEFAAANPGAGNPGSGSGGGNGYPGSGGGYASGSSSGGGGTPYSANNNMYDYLEQWFKSAQQQQTNAIDWATSQAIQEAQLAQDEANAQFQTQRNQVAIDEARAKDDQALYAERRGDRGGIGAAQYDSIMNTAAQNRLSVNQAQTKMAGDTARTISNLRAQGEYEKADALLELSQTYLAQLISLEQWSMQFGLSVAQFNAQLDQWDKEYQMKVADITGTFNGQPTMAAQQNLAEQGWTLLGMGLTPTESQMAAMGITGDQVNQYITNQRIQNSVRNAPKTEDEPVVADIDGLFEEALNHEHPWSWVKDNYKKYGLTSLPDQGEFDEFYEENTYTDEDISSMARAIATDIKKYHSTSDQDILDQIEKAFMAGNITQKEYRWLCAQLGV